MSELRFKSIIPESGSAARIAEQKVASPARLHVSAGSAARLSENEKRSEALAGRSLTGGSAGFSLRAQGGKVLRNSLDPAAGIVRNAESFDRTNDVATPFAASQKPDSPPATQSGETPGLVSSAVQNLRKLFRS